MAYTNSYTPPKEVGSPSVTTTVAGPFDISGTRSGSSNPNWKKNVRAGVSATGNFTGNLYDFKYERAGSSFMEWTTTNAPYKGLTFRQDLLGDLGAASRVDFFYPLLADYTAADNLAKANLYAAIKGAQTQMSGLVFLGELREALHMLRHPLQGLRSGMTDYLDRLSKRAKGRQSAASRKRILSDTWLEYSFGWMPFIHDLQDAQKALSRVMDRTQHTRVQGVGVVRDYRYHGFARDLATPKIWYKTTSRLVREIGVKYVAGVADTTAGKSDLSVATDAFGLSIQEFVPTAWELIPYSFVVDYFSNAGAVLSSVFTDTSGVRWISRTNRSVVTHEGEVVFDSAYSAENIGGFQMVTRVGGGGVGHFELKHKAVTRSESGLTPPSFMVTCPAFDSLKWVNLGALAAAHKKLVPYY